MMSLVFLYFQFISKSEVFDKHFRLKLDIGIFNVLFLVSKKNIRLNYFELRVKIILYYSHDHESLNYFNKYIGFYLGQWRSTDEQIQVIMSIKCR